MTDLIEDPSVALTLASVASKTRVRLNVRGIAVDPPESHAQRVVRFLARVAGEPYLASPEHNARALREYEATRDRLRAVVPPAPFKVTVNYVKAQS